MRREEVKKEEVSVSKEVQDLKKEVRDLKRSIDELSKTLTPQPEELKEEFPEWRPACPYGCSGGFCTSCIYRKQWWQSPFIYSSDHTSITGGDPTIRVFSSLSTSSDSN